jgi:hypothetical protein
MNKKEYNIRINYKTKSGLTNEINLNNLPKFLDETVVKFNLSYVDMNDNISLLNGFIKNIGSQLVFIETQINCAIEGNNLNVIYINQIDDNKDKLNYYEYPDSKQIILDLSGVNFAYRYNFNECSPIEFNPFDNKLIDFTIYAVYNHQNQLIRTINICENYNGDVYIELSNRLITLSRTNTNETVILQLDKKSKYKKKCINCIIS